jgi:hypothetical protein
LLTCALCNGEIAASSHFCPDCGAPGPEATADERLAWRDRHAAVAAGTPAATPSTAPWTPPAAQPSPPPPAPVSPPPAWRQPQPGPASPAPPFPNQSADWRLPTLPTVPGEPGKIGNVAARTVVLGAAAGLAIGSFLPWARVEAPFFGSRTISGIDGGDGWFTLIAGIVVAVLAFTNLEPVKTKVRKAYYGIGTGAILLTLFEFANAGHAFDKASEVSDGLVNAHFGFGLFLLLISAVGLIVGASKLQTAD